MDQKTVLPCLAHLILCVVIHQNLSPVKDTVMYEAVLQWKSSQVSASTTVSQILCNTSIKWQTTLTGTFADVFPHNLQFVLP